MHLITDGICASCCGVFTKNVKDSKSGKLYGYGGNPVKPNSLFDPGSVPGITVNSDKFNEYVSDGELPAESAPKPFARKGVAIGWSWSEIYSTDPESRDEILFFKEHPVDAIIPRDPKYHDHTPQGYFALADYIYENYIAPEWCAEWEVRYDQACDEKIPLNSHSIYGRKCVEHKFNGSGCVFAGCEKGYFRGKGNVCFRIPSVDFSIPPSDDFSQSNDYSQSDIFNVPSSPDRTSEIGFLHLKKSLTQSLLFVLLLFSIFHCNFLMESE